MDEHHISDGPQGGIHYRSPIFQQQSTVEKLGAIARKSPYFMIALAFNVTLLSFATIWRLQLPEKRESGVVFTSTTSRVEAEKQPDAQPTTKEIFTDENDSIEQPEKGSADDSPDLTFETMDFKWSDHDELDTGTPDGDSLRGTDLNSNFATINPGTAFLDVIGTGGGSARGSKRGYGIGTGGGDENLKKRRHRRDHQSKTTDAAVEAGLEWLARHQDASGAWLPDEFNKNCQVGAPCAHAKGFGYQEHVVGNTGLALLAFLGAGYDHRAPQSFIDPFTKKTIRFGDVIKSGLTWLRLQQNESGSYVDNMNSKWGYNHSIATLAMSEAYGLSRAIPWKQSAEKAIACLVAGQNAAPGGTGLWGWRYRPACGDNDISVTGWAIMALKSAELSGLKYSQESMEGGYQFCLEVTDKTSGHAGYTRREEAGMQVKAIGRNEDYANHPALAAVGMCVRTFVKHNVDDPMLEAGAKLLVHDLPAWNKEKKTNDYYYWYYATLALNQFDGPDSPRAGKGGYWKEWEAALKKALLEHQVHDRNLCSYGSWDGDDRWGVDGGGRVYATAINTLNFEVYYRYGNAFGSAKRPK
jgi:hypothetical protein